MSIPTQTVYFVPPTTISNLQASIGNTPGSVSTTNLVATGTISALGDITSGSISMRNLQDSIYNLQAAVNPQTVSAGAMNTQSFYGADTQTNQQTRAAVDEYSSKHIYDKGGLTSENIQYLQLESNSNIPTTLITQTMPIPYQSSSGTYIIGTSNSSLFYTGTTFSLNLNRLSRREQWNLLQDLNLITSSYSGTYNSFTGAGAWASGFAEPSDIWTGSATYSESIKNSRAGEFQSHVYGNYAHVWRYDINTKQVIARSIPNMTKQLWGTGSSNWLIATASDGFIAPIGQDKFVCNIINPSTYGLLIFDINLNACSILQSSQYGGVLSGVPGVNPLNFGSSEQTFKTFGVGQDQIRANIVKQWGYDELKDITYRNLFTNQVVDVFNGNTGSQATFLYVLSSSQQSYAANELVTNMGLTSVISPLSDAKWVNSSGKMIAWALMQNHPTGPSNTTGAVASLDGSYLVPVAIYKSCPDNYIIGDKLQLDSFTRNPLTNNYDPLTILYPMVDIRSEKIYATGTFRSTGAWQEGYYQTTFTSGSSTGYSTAGIQTLCVSIACMTGSTTTDAYIPDYDAAASLIFPNSKRMWQDVYAQYYVQATNASGTYFQQNYMNDGLITLSDPRVLWYPTLSPPSYYDSVTSKWYRQQSTGAYLSDTAQVDPSENAQLRQLILNNGFAIRHTFVPYNLYSPATGAGNLNPFVPPVYTINVNNSPLSVWGDFNMPDGTVFSIDGQYVSQPYSLVQRVWSSYTGAYNAVLSSTNLGVRYNNLYATTGASYSATGIKDYFEFTQRGIIQKVVEVLLPGDSYTGANNLIPQTVPVNSVVFRVKGEVFNGQPIKMTFQSTAANQQTLTPFMAKQLNYYGAGLYGQHSLYQDPNGNSHIFVGNGNGQYGPFSEHAGAANYAAQKFISDLATGRLTNIVSATTLRKLGLDSVILGENYRYAYTKTKTALYNTNGTFIVDCTIPGLTTLSFAIKKLVNNGYRSGFPSKLKAINQFTGLDVEANPDIVHGTYYNSLFPNTNAYGEDPTLTSTEYMEAQNLVGQIFGYHNQYMSNRKRSFISNMEACVNAKTLQVEHIIRNPKYPSEFFSGTQFQNCLGIAENYQLESSYQNIDHVDGTVTCGSQYMASKGKYYIQMWKNNNVNRGYATNMTYTGASSIARTRFACSYDGLLGQQINYTQIPNLVYNTTTSTTTVSSMTGYTGAFLGILSNYTGSYTGSDGYYTGTYGPLTVEIYSTGPLGPTVVISQSVSTSTTTSSIVYTTGPSYSYGNTSQLLPISSVGQLNNSMYYIGKQGGKDVFGYLNTAIRTDDVNVAWYTSPALYEIQDNMKLNFVDTIKGSSITYSPDSKLAFACPSQNAQNQLGQLFTAVQNSISIRHARAFTLDETTDSIKTLWMTLINDPGNPQLIRNTGAVGTMDLTTANYVRTAGVQGSSYPIVVNDVILGAFGAQIIALRADTGEVLAQYNGNDFGWDESYLPDQVSSVAANAPMTSQEEHMFGSIIYNKSKLHVVAGAWGLPGAGSLKSIQGAVGRELHTLSLVYQTPGTVNLTSLFVATGSVNGSNSQTVVFTPQDAISQNSNRWCLLTTFKTTDMYNNRKTQYVAKDDDYDGLYESGVTAIAIYDPTNIILNGYQTPSLDISTRIINGGSWYGRTGISFKNLLASGVVKFLYAGQIPYKCRAQTPYTISQDQIQEAVKIRRQKRLLSEYLRIKNGSTSPYPDNGLFAFGKQNIWRSVTQKPYFKWNATSDPAQSVIYNQSLGYTDVGIGRSLPTPL